MKPKLSFQGPFVRLGNTFFDKKELLFCTLPRGALTPLQYSEVSRLFLRNRHLENFEFFDKLPAFLKEHQNGILWRDMMLLVSFTMPKNYIRSLFGYFKSDIEDNKNPFILYHMVKMLLDSGVLEFLNASLNIFHQLPIEETNIYELSCLYAMFIETQTEYDKSSFDIIRSYEQNPSGFVPFLRPQITQLIDRYDKESATKVHCGKPCCIEDIALSLKECLNDPRFFERIYYEKVLLESYTGYDLRDFFTSLTLRPKTALLTMENFVKDVDLTSFKPGARYFFSKEILD